MLCELFAFKLDAWEILPQSWVSHRFGDVFRDTTKWTNSKWRGVAAAQPMTVNRKEAHEIAYDPQQILDTRERELLSNYKEHFLYFEDFETCFSAPLPARVLAKKPNLNGPSSRELFISISPEGQRVFALCQPYKAHLFGVDKTSILKETNDFFQRILKAMKKNNRQSQCHGQRPVNQITCESDSNEVKMQERSSIDVAVHVKNLDSMFELKKMTTVDGVAFPLEMFMQHAVKSITKAYRCVTL